jgi:signal transduction histidine kinase
MESFSALIADIVARVQAESMTHPYVPLILLAIGVLLVVCIGAYVFLALRGSAESRVSYLIASMAAMTEKLSQAEKIGNFGSFTWDVENPSASFWSLEMYALTGLVARRTAPAIDVFLEIAHEKDRESLVTAWKKVQTTHGPFTFTFRSVERSGQTRYLHIQGTSTVEHGELVRIVGVAHDITRSMEIDLAKTEFVSLASHQLKTPLTAVKWLAEGLLSGVAGELTPEQVQYVQKIGDSGERMIRMVNDLLNISRVELGTLSVRPEDLDVVALLQSVVAEQQSAADARRVRIDLVTIDAPPIVHVDKNLLRMILQNLISNAIKYSKVGGSVECEIASGGLREKVLSIRIADSGIGIPRTEQDHVFERLHRASNAQTLVPDGTGLGLYLIKKIIDHVGGSITFQSVEAKGTTFFVSVPREWEGRGVGTTQWIPTGASSV